MRSDHLSKHLRTHSKNRKEVRYIYAGCIKFKITNIFLQLKIEDMKIILENQSSQHQQDTQEQQQQFIIVQSQSLAGKNKLGSDDTVDAQDEIVYVLKDESAVDQPNVIQLDSNCVNQEQFVWITNNDQATDGSHAQGATTMYTIKEVNYSQVRTSI